MSKYGEPWVIDDATYCFNMLSSDGKIVDGDQEKMARAVALVNAMANIENPTEFMAEVRELLKRCWPIIKKERDLHWNSIQKCAKCDETHIPRQFYDCTLTKDMHAMLARLETAGRATHD